MKKRLTARSLARPRRLRPLLASTALALSCCWRCWSGAADWSAPRPPTAPPSTKRSAIRLRAWRRNSTPRLAPYSTPSMPIAPTLAVRRRYPTRPRRLWPRCRPPAAPPPRPTRPTSPPSSLVSLATRCAASSSWPRRPGRCPARAYPGRRARRGITTAAHTTIMVGLRVVAGARPAAAPSPGRRSM